ncbi:hypothetical protein EGW08_001103 [Elysia chlorotica]|uniref:C2H2-type domain-containing protein n=1 Tax=Elysia chlorotica TaxID=188477 RepID=A0A433UBF6_ELYCH|nr:hypothetical protein EGW08_001103 [Elysia chlorotica]
MDKRDLPENNAYFCDTCDRGFKTEEKYHEHVAGHMKCSYKDCPFIAAPKLVQLHISLQHRTGLAKKVWSMESEEDVKKWREERKRKFPTAANIAKKKEEHAERVARGEVLQTKDFSARGGGGGRGRGRGRGKWRGRGRGGRFDHLQPEQSKDKESESSNDSDGDGPPAEVAISHSQAVNMALENGDSRGEIPSKEEAARVTEGECDPAVSVVDQGSPNTTSLGLLSSYGFLSSDEEGEVENVERSEETSHKNETSLEEQCQPSPSKRPKLFPNPFLSPSDKSTRPSDQTENVAEKIVKPGDTGSGVKENSALQSEISSLDKESKSQSLTKLAEVMDADNSSNVSTSPCKGREDASKSPNKCKNQIPSIGVISTDTAEEEMIDGNVVAPKDNLTEDAYHKDTAKAETSSKEDKKGDRNKQTARKKAAGKNNSKPLTYTLLEKLLAPDIRRERNKILQCVHYIVKNKFFYPVSASTLSSNSTS